ncbi:cytoplasmic protein [Coprinopsis cinerea okayama7|uniref:Cytoplasmic protein n=1 Tax=Coprinopsis cinerea (strain Okayama-7 / 130 / ATCC MYA-4618 / FGSC 9003) TaxID=240176 RepID=A8NGP9_COPC7|nr:cytoplasmic protein [Coprinopsis cinerea okayama7\|eukprot:XP_001833568.1 cytoplasmic protein [Coprinopsis cinerea okayama7\
MTDLDTTLTSLAKPKTAATITVRIIKSFKFRTQKSLVLHNIDLTTTTVGQLKEIARQAVQTQTGWKPYRNVQLDTLKVYTKAHGSKTSNLIINLDNDDWILSDDTKVLADLDFENETEVSFFNLEDYNEFKKNPETSWAC